MSRAAHPQRAAIAGLVVHMRSEGVRQVDIATRLGISQSSVSTMLKAAGSAGHLEGQARMERNALIVRLRTEGLTQVEIGKRVGLTGSRVGVILSRIDASTREVVEKHARARTSRVQTAVHDILDCWADGLSLYDIHLLTGRTEGAIRQVMLRARRRRDPRATCRDSASRAAAARAA